MFKKLTKKFGSSGTKDKKDAPPASAAGVSAANNTAQSSSASPNASTSAAHTTPTILAPTPSSASASHSTSTTLRPSHSSSSPPLSPATPTDSPSPALPLDADSKSHKKKSSSRGERKDSEATTTTANGQMNGANGSSVSGSGSTSSTADDADDDESTAGSSSTPHQLTRADLLKPIPSLLDGLPSGNAANTQPATTAPTAAQQQLFIHKLRLCCILFDWSKDDTTTANPPAIAAAASSPTSFAAPTPAATTAPLNSKDARAKESKRIQLLELLEYIGKAKNLYNDTTLAELMHMIAANLFRALPPRSSELPSDEDEPVYEPSWSHLQIVYELFLRFIVNNEIDVRTLKRHIHASFVLHLLELFDSEDHRERDYLKTILHRIYAKFMSLRAFIRKAINHVFFVFIYEHDRHNGIAELLEILGSIINGFALPLKHEHKLFLKKVLIPMHKGSAAATAHLVMRLRVYGQATAALLLSFSALLLL